MTWTYRRVLAQPRVGRLLTAAVLARLGGEMLLLTLVLVALDRHGPQLAGLTVLAAAAPGAVVSPLAGAVLDRFGPQAGVAADLLAGAVLVGALAASTGSAGLLLLLAGLCSLTSPLGVAGLRTLLPRLVPEPALERVNALDIGAYGLVEVTGPVLAGALYAAAGGPVALATVAGLYAAAFLLLLGLPRSPGPGGTGGLGRAALAGVRYVLTHPVLRGLAVAYGLYQVAFGVLVVAVPVAAGGGARAGLLWGTTGLAGVLSALAAGHVGRPGRERAAITAGILATAAAAVPMAWAGPAGLVAGLVVVGLATGPVNVGLLTLRQRRTDPARLGRVLAVSISLNTVGLPVGAALAGPVVARSPTAAFALAGTVAALAALAAARLLRD
jgi:predicted MFS family arabinose efflux permease